MTRPIRSQSLKVTGFKVCVRTRKKKEQQVPRPVEPGHEGYGIQSLHEKGKKEEQQVPWRRTQKKMSSKSPGRRAGLRLTGFKACVRTQKKKEQQVPRPAEAVRILADIVSPNSWAYLVPL